MTMEKVMLKLLLERPFYGYAASLVTPWPKRGISTARMAAAPDLRLHYNPDWFESLPDDRQKGAVIHELLHLILLHPFRRERREEGAWAIACDMAVNEHIDRILLPEDAVTVEGISEHMKRRVPRSKSAEFYYRFLTEGDAPPSFLGQDGSVLVAVENGLSMKAELFSDETLSKVDMDSLKSELAQAVADAAEEGEVPGSLAPLVDEVYAGLKVNWRTVLKRFLSGHGKMETRRSYKRVSRRFDSFPGTKRAVGVRALLAVDESGSISDGRVRRFYRELRSINRITGASIEVSRFDTECSEPIPLNRYLEEQDRSKRGGTDFRPVFAMADKHRFRLLILFTDGDGAAPEAANQNVLWVLTPDGKKPAAFGHAVSFEE